MMWERRPTIDDWLLFGAGLAGVAVAAWIFFTADDPIVGDIGLVAGISGGEVAGYLLVRVRRHWMR